MLIMWQESTEIALGAIETIAVPLTLPDWDSKFKQHLQNPDTDKSEAPFHGLSYISFRKIHDHLVN